MNLLPNSEQKITERFLKLGISSSNYQSLESTTSIARREWFVYSTNKETIQFLRLQRMDTHLIFYLFTMSF